MNYRTWGAEEETMTLKESFAEIRNAQISGMTILGKLRDGKKTEVSTITELAAQMLRIGVALRNLKEVGL